MMKRTEVVSLAQIPQSFQQFVFSFNVSFNRVYQKPLSRKLAESFVLKIVSSEKQFRIKNFQKTNISRQSSL